MSKYIYIFVFTILCLTLSVSAQTYAKDDQGNTVTNVVDVMYAGTPHSPKRQKDIIPTDPDISLSPDKSELIRLGTEAKSVIVGNPQHLSVLVENSQTLVLVPQLPGATYFTVLDEDANVIMQRHVIVAAPKDNYIRIRRSCAGDAEGCRQTQVYYCPGACHEIGLNAEVQESSSDSSANGTSPTGLPPQNGQDYSNASASE